MAQDKELVKVIDSSVNSTKRSLAGVGVGVAAGAGTTAALLKKFTGKGKGKGKGKGEHDNTPGGPDTDVSKPRILGAFDREAAGIDSPKAEKGPKGKLMALGERKGWHWLGRTLQVQRRFGELQGSNVAAAVAMQLFLALFPLLLVATAVIGFIQSATDIDVVGKIMSSFGLGAGAEQSVRDLVASAEKKRAGAGIIGLITAVWSALGITSALQYAYNQAWQSGGRGVKDKAVGLTWMLSAGFLFAATALISTAVNWLPAGASVGAFGVTIILSFALWMITAKLLPNVQVHWKELVPGAILGTIGFEVLKFLGTVWVPKAVESQSAAYGTVGVVLAILAFVVLFGKLVMYSAVLNVITYESKHGKSETVIEVPTAAMPEQGVTRGGVTDRN